MLPADLQPLSDAMDAADRTADALAARLTDSEFFWRPDGATRWSVALCLDHLAVANAVYAHAIAKAIATARERGWTRRGPAQPGFFGRKFAESLEPPAKRRTRAPAKIVPQPARGRDEIMAAYRTAHVDIRRSIREAATIDANRAVFPNPFLPLIRVRVSTAFHVVAAHDRRHLWQAAEVEKALALSPLRRMEEERR